jgi:zinc transporter ZupT
VAGAHQRHQDAPGATANFEYASALAASQVEVERQVAFEGKGIVKSRQLRVAPGLMGLYKSAGRTDTVNSHSFQSSGDCYRQRGLLVVAFAILPFFSTLLGGTAALRLRHRLHPFMAFAAGVLVATALADLLPEASALLGENTSPLMPGAAAVVGFLAFSGLEAFVHRETWEHEHDRASPLVEAEASHSHEHPTALTVAGPLSLIAHSTLDGLAIGLAFRAGTEAGLLVGVAVLAHDFADGMNVVTLALAQGSRVTLARGLLLCDALAPLVGAAIGTFAQLDNAFLGGLLAAFAGVFIAVGAGHLLPEAQHRRPGASPALVLLAAIGSVLVLGVRSLLG